jgi:hypothetical protein
VTPIAGVVDTGDYALFRILINSKKPAIHLSPVPKHKHTINRRKQKHPPDNISPVAMKHRQKISLPTSQSEITAS